MIKKDIRDIPADQLLDFIIDNKIPKFRLEQIENWLWTNNVSLFSEMKNLPKELISLLQNQFSLNKITIEKKIKSIDGTLKCLLKLYDEKIIEAVLIPSEDRITLCISSQVGCSLDCSFCATAKLKYERNLYAYEIFDQVYIMNKLSKLEYGMGITNIVYMGMGEPFLNYKEVVKSINFINSQKKGLNISKRKITVSTSGIAKQIKAFADDCPTVNLALSLHCLDDYKRSNIMSINNSNNLESISEAIKYWYNKTKEPVTYEYIVWDEVNNTDEDIESLIKFAKKIPCKVNLIEYNNVEGSPYLKASSQVLDKYFQTLAKNNIVVTIRKSRGEDINGACGQLARKN